MNPATIIRDQIGRKAAVMLGAKDFLSDNEGRTLRFTIGRNAKSVNRIEVTLDPDDTYTMRFLSIRRKGGVPVVAVASECSGVYVDSLRSVIAHRHVHVSLTPSSNQED